MVEVDVYRVFYKSFETKSKFKLTVFLSNTMETKYFSESNKYLVWRQKAISWAIVHQSEAVKKGPKGGGHTEDAGRSCSFVTQSYNSVRKFGCCA